MADRPENSSTAKTSSRATISALTKLSNWFSRRRPPDQNPPERWVVVDTETSGLNSSSDRLLSIGAVAMHGGEILVCDSFEALIRQPQASSHENIVIHGISGSVQLGAQAESEVLRQFEVWRNGAPMLGWHIGFDLGFLRRAYGRHGIAGPPRETLDLAPLAQVLLKGRSNELDYYLNKLGISVQSRHSAAADAWMTALLASRLFEAAAREGADSFKSLRALAGNARWAGS